MGSFSYSAEDEPENQPLSLLDRFPDTPDGNVAFLEFVRDEVHKAAEAKQQLFARGYSEDPLENLVRDIPLANLVRGIKWNEPWARIVDLAKLIPGAVEQVRVVLGRDLTVETIEQIDGLLTPAVRKLRDAWEQSQDADSAIIVDDEAHGILPSDETDLGKLESLLRQDDDLQLVDEGRSDNQAAVRLLSVFTNGLSDEWLHKAASVLQNDGLTIDEKLTKIHALIPFPPTVSAEKLGKLLGVTKQAVLKTDWWIENRKGEKASEIGRRHDNARERAKQHEPTRTNDENE